jgi:hypothetical protein
VFYKLNLKVKLSVRLILACNSAVVTVTLKIILFGIIIKTDRVSRTQLADILMWIRNQLDVTLCYPLFLFYKLLNMFRATMCPFSGDDDSLILSPRVGIVLWLQEGCQDRLASSASMDALPANRT